MQINEQRIIKRVLNGDTQAFAVLVNQYQNVVYTICYKLVKDKADAEELAQRSFVKAYSSLSSFKMTASFSTWLYRIAYNTGLDWLKAKQRRYNDLSISDGEIELGDTLYADTKVLNEEERTLVSNAIDKLDERSQVAIVLYYYEEKSIKEIGEVLNISESNSKVILHRARKSLAELLVKQREELW